jgi:hypothetical protein
MGYSPKTVDDWNTNLEKEINNLDDFYETNTDDWSDMKYSEYKALLKVIKQRQELIAPTKTIKKNAK